MSDLITQLKASNSIPSPPGVALEIMRINQDEEVSIEELASVASRDPAIAAKILKAANSSLFGRPGQVADLSDAVMVLGTRTVNLLALSFSLASFSSTRSSGFPYARYWSETAVATLAARWLAKKCCRSLADEAFLGGLLADLGQLMLAECAADAYAPVVARMAASEDLPVHEIERECLGMDHAFIGREVLTGWGLPDLICEAVGAHHDPKPLELSDPEAYQLARVLHVATTCSALYVRGQMDHADELVALAGSYFGLGAAECQELVDHVCEEAPPFLAMLGLEGLEAGELERIRARANELLVQESLKLDHRLQSVSGTLERLAHRNTELERLLTIDPLTGLSNRVHLEDQLEFEMQRLGKQGGSMGLLIIDIDHFKQINDSHGHIVGDKVLREVARSLQSRLNEGHSAIRCGGDEFIVLCPGATAESLLDRAHMLRRAVEENIVKWQGKEIAATLSIGGCVANASAASEPTTALLASADAELYRAKEKGRNRVFITSLKASAL